MMVMITRYPESSAVLNSSSDNYQETKDLHFGGGLFLVRPVWVRSTGG